jgi:inner membrane protein
MEMTPLFWLLLGIAFFFIELSTPGFVALFFGVAAITVALLSWLLPIGQSAAWLIFALLSIVYILVLRRFLKKIFLGDKGESERLEDSFIGKFAEVTEAVKRNHPGKVEFAGSLWEAESDDEIEVGERVRITGKKNLTLFVGPVVLADTADESGEDG